MPENPIARWKLVCAYAAFSLFALMVAMVLTFPYETLKERLQSEAESAGLYLRIGSMGPGLGIRATDLRVSKKAAGDEAAPAESLEIEKITFRPSLWPLGLRVSMSALDGSATAVVGGVGDLDVQVELDELDLSKGNLKGFSGMDLTGKLSGKVELAIPRITPPGAKASEPDLGQAAGTVGLELTGLAVNGGTLSLTLGGEPMPVDLPKFTLGDLTGTLTFDKGQGKLDKFTGKGPGFDLEGSGTMKLAKKLSYAEPNLELRLKASPDFQKSLGVYGMGLAQLAPDPKDSNWRIAKVTGYLGRPTFR